MYEYAWHAQQKLFNYYDEKEERHGMCALTNGPISKVYISNTQICKYVAININPYVRN